MKKISEHYLFVINAILIAGLIGIGFWIQQSNAIIIPADPAAPNTQIVSAASSTATNITPVTTSTTVMVGQNILATTPTSTVTTQKKTATPPTIRRSRENESGEHYIDE